MKKSTKIIIGAIILVCVIGGTLFLLNNLGENKKFNYTNDNGTFYELELGKIYKDRNFTFFNITDNLSKSEGLGVKSYGKQDAEEKTSALLDYLNTVEFVAINDKAANDNYKNLDMQLSAPPEEFMLIIQIISEDVIYITSMEGEDSKYRYYKVDGESLDLDYIHDLLKE